MCPRVLIPELRPGDIVVMHNLPGHKVSGVEDVIRAAGAHSIICRHTVPI
jgi:hypothetical protein